MHRCIQCEPKSLIRDQTIHNKDNQVDFDSLDLVGAVQHGALDRVVSLYQQDSHHNEGKAHAGMQRNLMTGAAWIILFSCSVDSDGDGVTLLHWASINNRKEIAEFLIEK